MRNGRGRRPRPPTRRPRAARHSVAWGAAELGLVLDVLVLDVIAGPDPGQAVGWRLALPPPRSETLSGYRIGVWPDDPGCPVDTGVGDAIAAAVDALRAAGATLTE